MIVVNCAQGSPEWHQARAGVITASMFAVARSKVNCLTEQQRAYVDAILSGMSEKDAKDAAGYKAKPSSSAIQKALDGEPVGEFSEAAKDYAFRLAIERGSGEPLDEGFETWAMRRGHELEPYARAEHEMQSGLIVKTAGFILSDCRAFGASADGLIGDDSGAEYKCFIDPSRLRAFHLDNDADSIKDQVQGGMWLANRKTWHVGMYCPAMAVYDKQLWWQEFQRDDAYIAQLEADLIEFKQLVAQYSERIAA